MNLTDHFTLEELTRSETASRLGLDNTPAAEILDNLKLTAQYLERCRGIVQRVLGPDKGIVITSGYRAVAVNAAVGGKPTSAHCRGLAADIHVPGVRVLTLAQTLAQNLDGYDQIIHEFGSWVHIGLAAVGVTPRRQLLTIGGNPVQTRPGLLSLP